MSNPQSEFLEMVANLLRHPQHVAALMKAIGEMPMDDFAQVYVGPSLQQAGTVLGLLFVAWDDPESLDVYAPGIAEHTTVTRGDDGESLMVPLWGR